ncbi:MAG TPA: hypothetical protein VLJ16_09655 [Acidobacteriota bacterium]|nr:hypothetical protein [Acidobacteriota bacterium]
MDDGRSQETRAYGQAGLHEEVANDLDMRGSCNSPSFRVAEIPVGGRKG